MKVRLGPHDRIWVDGIACTVRSTTKAGHILRTVGSEQNRDPISHQAFEANLSSGAITIDRDHYMYADKYGKRGPPVADDLSSLSEEDLAETLFRLRYVQRFDELHTAGLTTRTDDGYALAAEAIYGEFRATALDQIRARGGRAPRGGTVSSERTPPSGSQLRRWCENHRTTGTGGLSPRTERCGNFKPRLHETVEVLLARAVSGYCSRNQPNATHIHRRLCRFVRVVNRRDGTDFKAPSYQTVCTRVNAIPVVDREVGRTSLEEAARNLLVSRGGLQTRNLLERVEIDEWRVDLFVLLEEADVWRRLSKEQRKLLKPVRCWITAAICCTSSVILALGLSLEAPSARSAIDAIRQVLEDKTSRAQAAGASTGWAFYGTPCNLGIDKGAGLASDDFLRVVTDLRCHIPSPPAKLPPMRGSIERWFGTVSRDLLPLFTGRTFRDVKARGEYDGQALASLFVAEFARAADRYVCDIYHRKPQAALGGRSPAQVWVREMAVGGVLPPPPPAKKRDIFGKRFIRILEKKGIRLAGDYYHSAQLDEIWLRDGSVSLEIRADAHDLSAISVSIGGARWISVNAVSGHRLSADDALAALKLMASLPPSEFDDPVEAARIVDQAYADLEELGEAARIKAGVSNPVASTKALAVLPRRHRGLWEARDAKRNSAGLDHLEGVGTEPKPKRKAAKRLPARTIEADAPTSPAPPTTGGGALIEPGSPMPADARPKAPRINVKR